MNFENNFEQNVGLFSDAFDKDDTFRIKYITNEKNTNIKIAVLLLNCMVSSDVVDRDVLRPLCTGTVYENIKDSEKSGLFAHSTTLEYNPQKALVSVASGDCAVIIGDNPCVITIDTKGMKQRDVSAPETEISLAGPMEGFNENIMTNLSLIKKRIMNPNLKNEFIWTAKQSNSVFAICYIEGIAKPQLIQKLKKRLEKIDTDYIADTSYIAEFIRDDKSSFIKTYGKTNRPDVMCARLMEGRIGIILNGSPTALTFPYIFVENFQTPDDYYLNCYYANVGRVLRFIGFYLSFLLPSVYIALIIHHKSMIPSPWLASISASQSGVPIPSILEMLLLFAVFEALRETGTRMPSSIGLALNIVGAIILGQAAVEAHLVSAPMVIIVSFSGVAGLMVNQLKGAVFYIRAAMILLSSTVGLVGVGVGFLLLNCLIGSMSSLDVPFMSAFPPFSKYCKNDTFLRRPTYKMNYRQPYFSNNKKRQGRE